MRKILTPFVAALLLLLTLAPQPMWADEPNFFTITNTDASSATSVSMKRSSSNSNNPQPTMYFRIFNSAGEQTVPASGWSSQKITGTSNVSLGSIPKGGKMQIYGVEAISTCSSDGYSTLYTTKFVMSGGTVVVSGNILSLSDYDTSNEVIKTKATWPNGYFAELFKSCTVLTSAENLEMPATTLGSSTCKSMFESCSNMTLPPKEMPATTIGRNCYQSLFRSCSKLVKSPKVYATSTNVTSGHYWMFDGCTALKTIHVNHEDWTGTSAFNNWVSSVPTSGTGLTFYCPPTLPRTISSTNNIPSSSWKIYSYNLTFQITGGANWANGTSANAHFTWMNDTTEVIDFLEAQEEVGIKFYTNAACTTEVSTSAIQARMHVQKEANISTTETYYAVRSATTYNVAIAAYNSDHGTVTVSYNDGTAKSFTTGNTNIDGGTELTITAVPATGYKLTGLTITPSGESATAHTSGNTYTPTKNITVTATFEAKSFTLTVSETDHGTITADPSTYAQDGVARAITTGTTVTFTASPAEHYVLSGWTGALSGTDLETSLTVGANMDETLTVGATFALEQFTISATSANNTMGSVTGGGTYSYGAAVTLTATANDGYRFVEWSDGNSSNPRNITVSQDLNLTATFALESTPQTVEVYQNATANTTKILYALTAKTVGGITYTPIDMGYGVAWSDKNMGATDQKPAGNYYAWGNLSSGTSFSATSYYNGSTGTAQGFANGTALPNDHDAANQTIGSYWHIPSPTQWTALLSNCSVSSYTYTGANGNSITLPATGYYNTNGSSTTSLSNTTQYYYWTNTKGFYSSTTGNNSGIIFEDGAINGNGTFEYDGRLGNGLAIRPIYVPTFTIYTLTINVGSYKYIYKCQSGQSITVNVHATELGASFDEWSEDHNTNATRTFTVTADATYTATFAEATTYAITFVDEDGETVLDGPNDVIEGNIPAYGGETPTKAATAQYTYAFDGWSPALYAADKAQTYTATYSSTVNQYTVTWKSENGESTLETDADQNYGTTTAFNGTTPTKAADAEYTYTFDGWATEANGDLAYANGSTPTVSGDATYFAHFNATEIVTAFDLEDNHEAGDDYYDDYAALVTAGNAIDITYKRSFKAGRWATFSLPFGYSFQNQSHNTFRDQVFELTSVDYADGRMVINCVKNSTGIVANTPYIFIPTSDIDNPTFEGVTPKAIAAGSKTVNNTKDNVYTVEFISTAYKQVMPTGKRTIYISGNRLYYANVDTDIPAFRGYFNLKGGDDVLHIQPRLVIAAPDGETIEQAEEAVAETRKYIENGILVIERNGVKYDAQGHVIK